MSDLESFPESKVTLADLPLQFKVKYLGSETARGLWGIKYTRRPVDHLVALAKTLPPNRTLAVCDLTVNSDGIIVETSNKSTSINSKMKFDIASISYGVQDLVYTRVFAMIIVRQGDDLKDENPFEVHAFVCDSRVLARKLTFALAASFQEYSKVVREAEKNGSNDLNSLNRSKKKFAVDLRSPEDIQKDIDEEIETEA